jgi:hypothetical protein
MFPKAIQPFFKFCDESWIGVQIRSNTYTFPLIEVIHLFGLTLLLGSVLLIDFRLLGFGMKRQPVSQVAAWASPALWTGLVMAAATGSLLFISEALKCYASLPFGVKMMFFALAIIFYSTIHRKITTSAVPASGIAQKLTGLFSIFLWFGIGLAGRAIAFY